MTICRIPPKPGHLREEADPLTALAAVRSCPAAATVGEALMWGVKTTLVFYGRTVGAGEPWLWSCGFRTPRSSRPRPTADQINVRAVEIVQSVVGGEIDVANDTSVVGARDLDVLSQGVSPLDFVREQTTWPRRSSRPSSAPGARLTPTARA